MNNDLVVILTALNLEYSAVRERLTDTRVHWHHADTRFETGRLGPDGCRIALGLVGKGNNSAAVLAERAITEFSPAALIFSGVAGGLWPNIKLGDVVVASQVYAYHGGTSEDDGLKARPRAWEISHRAAQIAQHLIRSGDWWATGSLPVNAPEVHFGPIAAGEIVQDSSVSAQAQWVRQHYNDALAIEMEGAGVAQAGHLNRALPVIVVRGISDRADGTKAASDGENWQPRAAVHAAAFATALARQLTIESRGANPRHGEGNPRMGPTFSNTASGNARVGVQAGQIFGPVTVGSPHEQAIDLAAAIAELRGMVHAAHRNGKLDDDTYKAAEAELDEADGCAAGGGRTGENRSRLRLALQRLRGLVADVTEIASRLATLLVSLKDVS